MVAKNNSQPSIITTTATTTIITTTPNTTTTDKTKEEETQDLASVKANKTSVKLFNLEPSMYYSIEVSFVICTGFCIMTIYIENLGQAHYLHQPQINLFSCRWNTWNLSNKSCFWHNSNNSVLGLSLLLLIVL